MTIRSKYLPVMLFFLFLYCNRTIAQEFKIRTELNPVPATGFYKIAITPELSGYANADLSDLRIAGDNGFVPYINQKETIKSAAEKFRDCSVLINHTEGKYTIVEFENQFAEGLTNISLIIGNTAVERYTSMSGSNDKNKWYIIDDSIKFHRSFTNNDGTYTQTIAFPLSRYRYFGLKINNGNTDPLQIIHAGTFKNDDTLITSGYVYNPIPVFVQKDSSNRISYIVVKNNAPYLTDKVYLHIAGPRFYNRGAAAYIMQNGNDSNSLLKPVAIFRVSSDSSCVFKINSQKAKTILIEINNQDNPPLNLAGITTSQEIQYLICWLEKGKAYSLLAGNSSASKPNYDLSAFSNKIPEVVPKLNYGPLKLTPATSTFMKSSNNYWLWPTIIVSIIVLSFLTYRLMKDMKQSES